MKSFIALALIPECLLKLTLEALYATTTENDQLHLYLGYFEKKWVGNMYVEVDENPDFKPAIWNQFSNAITGNQKTNNSVGG